MPSCSWRRSCPAPARRGSTTRPSSSATTGGARPKSDDALRPGPGEPDSAASDAAALGDSGAPDVTPVVDDASDAADIPDATDASAPEAPGPLADAPVDDASPPGNDVVVTGSTFPCDSQTCTAPQQFCYKQLNQGVYKSGCEDTSIFSCQTNPSCACLSTPLSCPQQTCSESGGEVTISCTYP